MRFKATVDGQSVHGTVQRIGDGSAEGAVSDRSYALQVFEVEPGIYWLKYQDRSFQAFVTADTSGYFVEIGNRRFQVEIEDGQRLRKQGSRGQHGTVEIKAPMPGKVVRVLAAEGSTVESQQGILVMEAMKMQNEIKTPKSGVVKKVYVQAGDAVNAGDVLASLE